VLFAVLTLLWFLAGRRDRPGYPRATSRTFVTGTAACTVVLAGSALLPADKRPVVWGLVGGAYLTGFVLVTVAATPVVFASLTITDALIERFGLMIIIVLGETVTGVTIGLGRVAVDGLTLAVALVGVVVAFGAWWTYFDFAGHRPPRRDRTSTLVWILAHLPLTAALAVMGAAMAGLASHAHVARTPTATA
jgi:low temperature requirement protein LtrA